MRLINLTWPTFQGKAVIRTVWALTWEWAWRLALTVAKFFWAIALRDKENTMPDVEQKYLEFALYFKFVLRFCIILSRSCSELSGKQRAKDAGQEQRPWPGHSHPHTHLPAMLVIYQGVHPAVASERAQRSKIEGLQKRYKTLKHRWMKE